MSSEQLFQFTAPIETPQSNQGGTDQQEEDPQVVNMAIFDDDSAAMDLDSDANGSPKPGLSSERLFADVKHDQASDPSHEVSTSSLMPQPQALSSASPARQKSWTPHHRRQRKLTHRAATIDAISDNVPNPLSASTSLPNFPTGWDNENHEEHVREARDATQEAKVKAIKEKMNKERQARNIAAWKELQAKMKKRRDDRRNANELAAEIEQMFL
ncbi:hypothetical protein QBC41DRAFT_336110 [Cercophora samala]|uniref:Uncharacterized protein n=1 Tax=Cercophora samala TaxID=330535 RepID=A0AA40DBE1_9PEZI|nr:hypothetical protein QBC41DRAFT_336110 [Cercophora samala]